MITLKNEKLTVKIKPHGAELSSIVDNETGNEYLWQGDPAIWNGQAPILFPIAGRLSSDSFTYNGQKYYLQKHGFARKSAFSVDSATENSACFSLSSGEETRRVYPFDFVLTANYALYDDTIKISNTVKNTGDREMYFSLGAHPAFKINIGDSVIFSEKETLTTCLFDEYGLVSGKKTLAEDQDCVVITEHIFDGDALFFPSLKSTSAKIVTTEGKSLLKMTFGSVPFVGLWAKPGAPFVCIEPWHGIGDDQNVSGKIEEKPFINRLPIGETFKFEYSIKIL